MRPLLATRWIALLILLFPFISLSLDASPLKGTLALTGQMKHQSPFQAPGYWQRPNGILSIKEPNWDPRQEMVVVIRGSGLSMPPPAAELLIEDFQFVPSILPVHEQTTVTVINRDPTTHIIEPVENNFMKALTVPPRSNITFRLPKAGQYQLRSSEYPHMLVSILAIDTPAFILAEASGAFRFADIPNGHLSLEVWYRGQWIHKQPIEVKGRTSLVIPI